MVKPLLKAWKTDENFFVDNNIPRNFTNESEVGLITAPVQVFRGSPYVPAASLSYDVLPENDAEDSIQRLFMENDLKEVETSNRIHSVIILQKLQREIEKSNKELNEVELKNKNMILLDKKNIQPLLNKFHQDLKVRKKEIEKIRLRLQVSSSEIIHI